MVDPALALMKTWGVKTLHKRYPAYSYLIRVEEDSLSGFFLSNNTKTRPAYHFFAETKTLSNMLNLVKQHHADFSDGNEALIVQNNTIQ